ncbi:hypothetical protein HDU79_006732 [Rhizoclosmatium sp. JEL0117]|nr:hypothetical protein HDU79_006732 [Rhizoclosmatium sp. JEL0117]
MPLPPILSPPKPPPLQQGYPVSTLEPEHRPLFDKIRAHVDAVFANNSLTGTPLPGEKEWADDETIVRYLRSTKFDADKACVNIVKTLQWRRDYRPTEITPAEIEPESINGKCFFQSFDHASRPIFILNSAITYSKDPERYLRLILFNLEHGTKLCPPGVSQVCAIADVEGVTMFNQNPLSITTRLAEVFQAHYPERLGWVCIMNPSWYLWVLAKLVLPWIDPVTKAKINFSTTRPKQKEKKSGSEETDESAVGTGGWIDDLSHLMDVGQLSVALGGKYDYVYEHSVYWPQFLKAVGLKP